MDTGLNTRTTRILPQSVDPVVSLSISNKFRAARADTNNDDNNYGGDIADNVVNGGESFDGCDTDSSTTLTNTSDFSDFSEFGNMQWRRALKSSPPKTSRTSVSEKMNPPKSLPSKIKHAPPRVHILPPVPSSSISSIEETSESDDSTIASSAVSSIEIYPLGRTSFGHQFLSIPQIEFEGNNVKSISPRIIIDDDPNLKRLILSDNRKERHAGIRVLERALIETQGRCPGITDSILRPLSYQLRDLHNKQFDSNYQNNMGCVVDSMINQPSILKNYRNIFADINLKEQVGSITKIGVDSRYGSVYLLHNKRDVPLYVMKVANQIVEGVQNDSVYHEAIIALGALNKLRDQVPNFVHIYGTFTCGPTISVDYLDKSINDPTTSIDYDDKELTDPVFMCSTDSPNYLHIIEEYVPHARTLREEFETITTAEYVNVLLQVANALNLAYKKFDFTHYDLHPGNILIQRLSYYIAIPIYGDTTKYLRTKILARIIDYGMSHITLEGYHLGNNAMESVHLRGDIAYPLCDIWRLVITSVYIFEDLVKDQLRKHATIKGNHYRTLHTLSLLIYNGYQHIKEFNIKDLHYRTMTLDGFISYLIDHYGLNNIVSVAFPLAATASVCTDGDCINWNDFVNEVYDLNLHPTTAKDLAGAFIAADEMPASDHKSNLIKWLYDDDIHSILITSCADINDMLGRIREAIDFLKEYDIDEGWIQCLLITHAKLVDANVHISSIYYLYTLMHGDLQPDFRIIAENLTTFYDRVADYEKLVIELCKEALPQCVDKLRNHRPFLKFIMRVCSTTYAP